jgi:translation initiation factor 4E
MKRVLAFPPDTKVEWKSHDSSIQQRSAIDDARKDRNNNVSHHSEKRNGGKEEYAADKK